MATKGSYFADLIEIAGGQPLLSPATHNYVKITAEAVVSLNPDVILDMVQAVAAPVTLIAGNTKLAEDPSGVWRDLDNVRAVEEGRVYPAAGLVDEETAISLGVDVRRVEKIVYAASSLIVGATVAVAGPIGFVGLIVPHAARVMFGEDVRIVVPCSLLLGASFLVLADAVARTVLGGSELPVGAVTALVGGPTFLWLLRRRQRYSAL